MDIKSLEKKVSELINSIIEDMGMFSENVQLKKMKRKFLLKVVVDKEGGVTLDDCANVSREVAAILDVEDPIPYAYILEVSSPGLDRPLKKPEDFKRFSGSMARVITSRPIQEQTFFVGKIVNAGDVDINLLLPKDRMIIIPYKDISRARLEVKI